MQAATAVTYHNRAIRDIRFLWQTATLLKSSHQHIEKRYKEILLRLKNCPTWVIFGVTSVYNELYYNNQKELELSFNKNNEVVFYWKNTKEKFS